MPCRGPSARVLPLLPAASSPFIAHPARGVVCSSGPLVPPRGPHACVRICIPYIATCASALLRHSGCSTSSSDLREPPGDYQRATVEQLLHEVLNPEQLQSGDAGNEEVHGDERADCVEAAGP